VFIVQELLSLAVKQRASDIHISAEQPAMIRVDGDLSILNNNLLTQNAVQNLLYSIMTKEQQKLLEQQLDIDFAFEIKELARFRVNIFQHKRGLGGSFRIIPTNILSLETLGFSNSVKNLCHLKQGLILITGATGSGKSTTLAAMIDHINQHRPAHIVTIEDPIEFIHTSKKALIHQRELHQHTHTMEHALKSALREDPDIIMVGEMRDQATIQLALTAAETGHLVFGTLHTMSAVKTIDRIIDVFPAESKNMVRSMLSESLTGVISQTLLPKINGGRLAAQEILLSNAAVRNLIRENKIPQLYSAIQMGTSEGMRTMEMHRQQLVDKNLIKDSL
jgi:twitching motility protein PilT